jgi:16S rRNA (uracil1498-N3)-methyltransferase
VSLRLFVDAALSAGLALDLPPGPARHVQVRRLQPGDGLVLFDGHGGEWDAEVLQMGRQTVQVQVGRFHPVDREPAVAVTLALGMPANERMDWLVEKATELGVAAIRPLVTERSVLRLAGERAQRKQAHWQAIAVAAAEQSGRTRVPVIHPVRAWSDADALPAGARGWVLSLAPEATRAPALAQATGEVLLLSGPEGGLAPAEETRALSVGLRPLSLGPRVLRAETAPLAALAWATCG